MPTTSYKRPHVDIFICIEMARERNRIIKKKTPGIVVLTGIDNERTNESSCSACLFLRTHPFLSPTDTIGT